MALDVAPLETRGPTEPDRVGPGTTGVISAPHQVVIAVGLFMPTRPFRQAGVLAPSRKGTKACFLIPKVIAAAIGGWISAEVTDAATSITFQRAAHDPISCGPPAPAGWAFEWRAVAPHGARPAAAPGTGPRRRRDPRAQLDGPRVAGQAGAPGLRQGGWCPCGPTGESDPVRTPRRSG